MPLPYKIARSKIHGYGVIATHFIRKGEDVVDPISMNDRNFGGFNHSCSPNLLLMEQDNRALRDILPGEELTAFYRSRPVFLKRGRCYCGWCNGNGPSKEDIIAANIQLYQGFDL